MNDTLKASPAARKQLALVRALNSLLAITVAPVDAELRPADDSIAIGDIAVVTTRGKRHYALVIDVVRDKIVTAHLTRSAIKAAYGLYDPRVKDVQYGEIRAAQAERHHNDVEAARRHGEIQHHVAKAFLHAPHLAFAHITARTAKRDQVEVFVRVNNGSGAVAQAHARRYADLLAN